MPARKVPADISGRHRADQLHAVDSVERSFQLAVPHHEKAHMGELLMDAPESLGDDVDGLEGQEDARVHERERLVARGELGGLVGQHVGADGAFLGLHAVGAELLRGGSPEEESHACVTVHEPGEQPKDGTHEPAGARALRHGEPWSAVPPAPKHDPPRNAIGEGGHHLDALCPIRHRRARGGNRRRMVLPRFQGTFPPGKKAAVGVVFPEVTGLHVHATGAERRQHCALVNRRIDCPPADLHRRAVLYHQYPRISFHAVHDASSA